ncbi:hypothetical protein MBAV_001998 [Candidatus Magnetobacterium bavaricum]|uniref:Uncharacterized protein n=1 Tax=Candidatus Magnetobacterium bavaricum TaxID=29290 RepID=A0A0F3GV31_9BACT|nr:hypothetical protein MBAV_001998 [Candidatus Magnetobacterium bavaricum]
MLSTTVNHGKFVPAYKLRVSSFIFHGKRKKEGGSAPSSDLPCKGTSPLDPHFTMLF